jgi:Ca-activated chloride channel homolog
MWFLWPERLWLLLLLPLLVAFYFWLLGRRKNVALRYPSLVWVKDAVPAKSLWRRHVPPLLLLSVFGLLVVAAARPVARITLPTQEQTIILAMDVSLSMRANDVTPSRLIASQTAAKNFVADLPRNVRVGVVAFGGSAELVQQPTLSRDDVVGAIDRLHLQRATAIGSAILVSLATFFPDAGIDVWQANEKRSGARPLPSGSDPEPGASPRSFEPVAPGSYASGAIVLLTDGQRTTGPDPVDAARMAAARGVKVFTVGFGTKEGDVITSEGWTMRVSLDEETLKKVADITLGEYFYAGSANDLSKVYGALNARLVLETRETEITSLFAHAAALLLLLGVGLSLWWYGRVI